MKFMKQRKLKKSAHELLRHTHHMRNMREDILSDEQLQELTNQENKLRSALETSNSQQIETCIESLTETINSIAPQSKGGGLRENFEILVVALTVAMALRAYFIQPFKIPTGSMQPTLYGITSAGKSSPEIMDRFPLKLFKFIAFGEWYSERHASASGTLSRPAQSPKDPSVYLYTIGGRKHKIPKDAENMYSPGRDELKFKPGQIVNKGDLLWSGTVKRGDHVFVNKVIWNFRKPNRGEIMVFKTTDIDGLQPGTHYIKRMCGLPNEKVNIVEPNLIVDDNVITEPETIAKIARLDDGYYGYKRDGKFTKYGYEYQLNDSQYFAMGDNTGNSRDSRYWGHVPEKNLVGPAVIVYWPFSKRWGLAK